MREEIFSTGIDIGTSTTQVVFSRIVIENIASVASVPRISIIDKEIIYRSPIYFTPLLSLTQIDGEGVRQIVEEEFKKAGLKTEAISTGAVIITGETARKENASRVVNVLGDLAGDFVVATAGPDLEAIIAGKGAGAEKLSRQKGCTVMNMDIGGGTTNIAVFKNGEIIDTSCLDIGGRLIKLDLTTEKFLYISPKIQRLAKGLGIKIEAGLKVKERELAMITKAMANILEEAVGIKAKSEDYTKLLTTKDLKGGYPIDIITFSGGVADYIYNSKETETYKYGDIGILLGKAIKASELTTRIQTVKPVETLNATVVGAGAHSMELSGSTITFTQNVFPLKNIPIIKVNQREKLSEIIQEKMKWFCVENRIQQVAIALKGKQNPSFLEVQQMGDWLITGIGDLLEELQQLIVVIENDMAKVLGHTLYRQLEYKKAVICIDGINVDNGDYIDIGKPLANGRVVPVVIKTLVFNS
ncbi:ethanolamine ammonia-lyase reactivating factor EutA [Alkaliphilus serpentinus]|uniref:Ethanolamine ammonia-lyase reactivating factor EutA n=1 Tax=Alkaliphilus serpentinus TaxID=1482731 RepID=A0A833MCJ8_9FIRM|nr:ethanolamine ammonia-lyase reactivating factor EutA [Alkaliphilus serpentinus]KAB3525598.1 ethanolamine ammonia-lyase reactivating factor EutA [Alkaliphilus serpentinus]